MKGDFSKKPAKTAPNDLAVLFQQGRVISDRDLTEAEMIAEDGAPELAQTAADVAAADSFFQDRTAEPRAEDSK